jgi:RNA polymerase sigma factor (sigma-70 family)
MPRPAAVLVRLAAPASAPDAQLLHRFLAAQADDAFAELVRRHGPMVLAVCRRVLSDAHDAEDAFQAVFIVLARKAGAIRGTNLAGWLYGVAVRTARGVRLTRDRRRKRERAAGGGRPAAAAGPATDHDTARIIDEELARLPAHYRDAVVACELGGLSRKEAAAGLGVPEGTLSSRLAAAKKKLAESLSARGVTGAAVLTAALAPAALPAALLEATALAVRGAAGGAAGAAASTVLKGMLFEQLRTGVLAAAVLVAGVCGGLAMTGSPAAPPAKAVAPATRPVADPAVEMVKKLGSDDFAEREAAQGALREIGAKAEPALRAGLKSESPEVRARCAKVLTDVRRDALDDLVRTFDPAGDKEPGHPVWKRFKAVAGDTRGSRELFGRFAARSRLAAIQAGDNWLARLDAAETGREAAGRQYREVAAAFARHVRENMKVSFLIPVWPVDQADEAAFLLFLGTYPGTSGGPPSGEKDAELFYEGENRLHYARGLPLGLDGEMLDPAKWDGKPIKAPAGTDRAFARLFTAWLENRDPTAHNIPACLWLAAKHGTKDVLPLARAIAGDYFQHSRLPSPGLYAAALAVVARCGTTADRPLFERHFKNDMAVATQEASVPPGATPPPTLVVELRDAALALALLLHDRDQSEFGFAGAEKRFRRADGRPVLADYEPIHFGFGDDKSRAAAHAKAGAFLAKQKPEPKEEPKPDPAAAKLVERLGSADFAEREAAQKELRKLGAKAAPALEAGRKSENPEVRARCAKILTEIRRDALDDLAKNFDPKAEKQPDHPIWNRFKDITGDSRDSRDLFARVIANRKWLQTLDKADADPAAAGHVYRVGLAEVFRDFHNDLANTPPWPCDRPEEVAYLMFLGSYADDPTTKPVGDEIVPQNLRNVEFLGRGIIRGEGQITHAVGLERGLEGKPQDASKEDRPVAAGAEGTDRAFAKLFAAWLARRDPASEAVPAAFRRALAYRIPEALPVARRYAANDFEPKRGVPPLATITALEVVAQFGTPADRPLFERHFGNETNVAAIDKPRDDGARDYYRPAPLTDTTQMRDVALGLALLLHDGTPEDFGFAVREGYFKKAGDRYAIPGSSQLHLGFKREEDRAAAFKKAKAWLDAQKK